MSQVFSRGQLACQAVGPTLFGAAPGAGKVGTASVDEVKVQVRWLKGRNPWTLIDGIDGLSGPIFSSNCHVFFFFGGVFLDTASDGGFLFRFLSLVFFVSWKMTSLSHCTQIAASVDCSKYSLAAFRAWCGPYFRWISGAPPPKLGFVRGHDEPCTFQVVYVLPSPFNSIHIWPQRVFFVLPGALRKWVRILGAKNLHTKWTLDKKAGRKRWLWSLREGSRRKNWGMLAFYWKWVVFKLL